MLDQERVLKLEAEISILQARNCQLEWRNSFMYQELSKQKEIHKQLGTTLFIQSIDCALKMCKSAEPFLTEVK